MRTHEPQYTQPQYTRTCRKLFISVRCCLHKRAHGSGASGGGPAGLSVRVWRPMYLRGVRWATLDGGPARPRSRSQGSKSATRIDAQRRPPSFSRRSHFRAPCCLSDSRINLSEHVRINYVLSLSL